ncbi:MAG: helix-turn-helix domain-containing protein [Richelia sp. CSU_2_1]|nr:helix-turn-helix domain-containing protein [Microcoleus sp. SU_5_3]NJR24531.1 helix-turn-helix domain-containing protein [Richelia sp. CSU_2_1]
MPVIIAIKKLRESRGLSQNDLARLTGYSPQFIQKIEQGKAKSLTLDAAERFVKALNCAPGDLLEWSAEPDKPDSTTAKPSGNINQATKGKQIKNNRPEKLRLQSSF